MTKDLPTPDLTAMTRHEPPKRKLDLSSLALFLLGCATGIYAYVLTQTTEANALVLVPSVVTATIGALNITTTKSPR